MTKEHINPEALFPSVELGFSQVVAARGGKTVYLSGQTAWNAAKEIVGWGDLREQTRQACRNLQAAVEAAGGTLADVVSLRVYIVKLKRADAGRVGEVLREFFPRETPPASTLIGVWSLAVSDFLIEIEAIAVVD